MGWLSRGGLASGDGGERMPYLLMLANRSLPERPSSRPTPERLVPPKGTAVAALWQMLPSIPTPRFPSLAADCHSRAGIPPPSGSAAPAGSCPDTKGH
jgi:hypothetical protein